MFTGIIQTTTKVLASKKLNKDLELTFLTPKGFRLKLGQSIATDGVCLTVSRIQKNTYTTQLMPETLAKTTFGKKVPQEVNIETSLKLADFLDGHLVLGHVDAVGKIKTVKQIGESKVYTIEFPTEFASLIAAKGCVAVNGISLTVVNVAKNWFSVSLVDYTIKHTTLGNKLAGVAVNLEFDIMAKYLDRFMSIKKGRQK